METTGVKVKDKKMRSHGQKVVPLSIEDALGVYNAKPLGQILFHFEIIYYFKIENNYPLDWFFKIDLDSRSRSH